jgi:hypothetical protein
MHAPVQGSGQFGRPAQGGGGQARISEDDYIENAPELVVEVAPKEGREEKIRQGA